MDVLFESLIPFFIILLTLMVVHEAAHYCTAKLFGVTVLEAGIGLPPKVWGVMWRGTEYSINAIPFGAFVRMLGEEDPTAPTSLAAQPKWKRIIIIGSGAFANLVLAIVLFTISLMVPHEVAAGGAAIAEVAPQSPAQAADLRAGDEIVEVNGRDVKNVGEASYLIRLHQGSTIDITIERTDPQSGSKIVETKRVYSRWDPPAIEDECGVPEQQGPTGIRLQSTSAQPVSLTQEERQDLFDANKKAFSQYREEIDPGAPEWCFGGAEFGFSPLTAAQCDALGEEQRAEAVALRDELFPNSRFPCFEWRPGTFYETITDTESSGPIQAMRDGTRLAFESLILMRNQVWILLRGFDSISPITGPVGIAQATGEVVDVAGWEALIAFAASISMSLAVLNFLPLPMVDGGRLFFIFIEFVRGRRIAPEKEALVHLIGFATLVAIAAIITYFDIVRIVNGDSLLR